MLTKLLSNRIILVLENYFMKTAIEKSLSNVISNTIDEMYDFAIENGKKGGKL